MSRTVAQNAISWMVRVDDGSGRLVPIGAVDLMGGDLHGAYLSSCSLCEITVEIGVDRRKAQDALVKHWEEAHLDESLG